MFDVVVKKISLKILKEKLFSEKKNPFRKGYEIRMNLDRTVLKSLYFHFDPFSEM